MKISNCCGKHGFVNTPNGMIPSEDVNICPVCEEHCEYVDEEAEEGSIMSDMAELKILLDKHKELNGK